MSTHRDMEYMYLSACNISYAYGPFGITLRNGVSPQVDGLAGTPSYWGQAAVAGTLAELEH